MCQAPAIVAKILVDVPVVDACIRENLPKEALRDGFAAAIAAG